MTASKLDPHAHTLKAQEAPQSSPARSKGPTSPKSQLNAAKWPASGMGLELYPDASKYLRKPTGCCENCHRDAKEWFVASAIDGWRYYRNSVEFAGPSPMAACTKACAKEISGSDVSKFTST